MSCIAAATERTTEPCQDQTYTTETIGGQKFSRLKGGKFTFGDPDAGLDNPKHEATIAPFSVATTETTNAQVDAYIADQGAKTHALISRGSNGQILILARGTEKEVNEMNAVQVDNGGKLVCNSLDCRVTYSGTVRVVPPADRLQGLSAEFALADHPAVRITVYEAVGYADYLSHKPEFKGREVRLLTSDEWEYAAEAAQDLKYATKTGELEMAGHKLAQYDASTTESVGHFLPNAFGLHDMTGNALEWTSDLYNSYYPYRRVLRGGSWSNNNPQSLRAVFRYFSVPDPDDRGGEIGFRVAVAASSQDSH